MIAMPMLAKARLVRSQARNVLSKAKWSLATEPLFSNDTEPYLSAILLYQDGRSSLSSSVFAFDEGPGDGLVRVF